MFASHDLTIPYACVFVTFMLWILSIFPLRYYGKGVEGGFDNKLPRSHYAKHDNNIMLCRALGVGLGGQGSSSTNLCFSQLRTMSRFLFHSL